MSKKQSKQAVTLTFASAVAFLGQGEDVSHLHKDVEDFMKARNLPDEARDDILDAVATFRAAMAWGVDTENGQVNSLDDVSADEIQAFLASLGDDEDEVINEDELERL